MAYRPSDLGKLPEEWESVKLGRIMKVRQGLQIPISDRLNKPTQTSMEYITIQSINRIGQEREYIESPSSRVVCKAEDVLMTRTGNTGIVVTGVSGAFHNNFFLMDFNRKKIDRFFLVNYLRSPRVQHIILTKAGASTIPDLNHKDFYSIDFPLAPLPEQKKIAQILSTWDNAISATERLLENSQQRKKALMQQLLTGKKRLPGFEGEWRIISLLSFGKCIRGVSYKPDDILTDESKETVRLLRSTNIQNGSLNDKEIVILPKKLVKPLQMLKKGDLAICMANGSKSLVGKSAPYVKDQSNYTVGAFCALFRPRFDASHGFIKFIFESSEYHRQLLLILAGSSINNLKGTDIESMKIHAPLCTDEQQAIAGVLTTADQEIDALQKRLDHLKLEKKALMQQLLTGKRRVKVDAAA